MNLTSNQARKKQLRRQLRQLRQQLSVQQLRDAETQLLNQYQYFVQKKNINKIAIYLQNDNELATGQLIDYLFTSNRDLYLPKIADSTDQSMQFVQYQQNSEMMENRFGIPEPVSNKRIAVEQLDLMFLPLTAFDLQGNRLGMGGGYYDRTLANISENKPILAGLAYDFQRIENCPVDTFDQPIQFILTPSRIISF